MKTWTSICAAIIVAAVGAAHADWRTDLYIVPGSQNLVVLEQMPSGPTTGGYYQVGTRYVYGTMDATQENATISVTVDLQRRGRAEAPVETMSIVESELFPMARYPTMKLELTLAEGLPDPVTRPMWPPGSATPDTVLAEGTLEYRGVEVPVQTSIVIHQYSASPQYEQAYVRFEGSVPVRPGAFGAVNPQFSRFAGLFTLRFILFARSVPSYSAPASPYQTIQRSAHTWTKERGLRTWGVENYIAGALATEPDGDLTSIVSRHGIDVAELVDAFEQRIRERDAVSPPPAAIPSRRSRVPGPQWEVYGSLLKAANREAWLIGERELLRPEHLVLGVLRQDTLWATQWLNERGLTYERLRRGYGEQPRPAADVTLVGNPFHPDKWGDSTITYSRNVWDMIWHEGKLWFGHGDYGSNTGPIDIISYDPREDRFAVEFTAPDETISRFRVIDGKLHSPGTDPKGPWDLGNVYRQTTDGSWETVRTVPDAVHMFDVVEHDGALWVSGPYRSTDAGQTWTKIDVGREYVLNFLTIKGELFGVGDAEHVYRLTESGAERVRTDIIPDGFPSGRSDIMQMANFGEADIYVVAHGMSWRSVALGAFHADRITGAERVRLPNADDVAHDVTVCDGTAYLLANRRASGEGPVTVVIYGSSDLEQWTEVARFTAPTLARSFEYVPPESAFYVGLGTVHGDVEPHSGDILRVVPRAE